VQPRRPSNSRVTRWRTTVTALLAQHDQVEVVNRDRGIGQRRAHCGGIAGVRVDHHHLDAVTERLGTRAQSGPHCPRVIP
jgi:hypothetical protein